MNIRRSIWREMDETGTLQTEIVHSDVFFQNFFNINSKVFETIISVVKYIYLSFDAIVRQDCFRQAKFSISIEGSSLIPDNDDTEFFVNISNAVVRNSVPNLTIILNDDIISEVALLVNSSEPVNTKTPDLEISIVLSNDNVVSQRPRHIP
ncbi:peptidase A2 domain-containing protein [Nephila pilipes]|uniref:Peptidase A2 domain-containing protein n=1 Tax=Nephila pilipes TaxID=299642 RepID=A0A8X6US72_NEPPI|nr:peptidase A2 domain-containing protein [Nephila pilipes]